MIGRNLRKMYFERKRKQLIEKGMLTSPDEELNMADETAEEQVLSWATKVRLRAVQLPKKLVAPPKAPPRAKPARPPRKEVEQVTAVTHAHRAPARYGGRVLSAVQNIESKHEAENSWQTTKSMARIEVTETTQTIVAVPVDPFAPAPGEAREMPATATVVTTTTVKKAIRPSPAVAALGAPKPFKPLTPKPVESSAEEEPEAKAPPTFPSSDAAKSMKKPPKLPQKPAEPEAQETGSEDAEGAKRPPLLPKKSTAVDGPKKPARNSEVTEPTQGEIKNAGVSLSPRAPPPKPSRESVAVAETSTDARDSEIFDQETPKPKPKGPPPKARGRVDTDLSSPSSSSTNTEESVLSSEAPAQARPKPPKLSRQQKES
jgi:hypothetical protein